MREKGTTADNCDADLHSSSNNTQVSKIYIAVRLIAYEAARGCIIKANLS